MNTPIPLVDLQAQYADIRAEVESLKQKGINIIGEPMPGAEGLSVFLHPKGTRGILVELVEKE